MALTHLQVVVVGVSTGLFGYWTEIVTGLEPCLGKSSTLSLVPALSCQGNFGKCFLDFPAFLSFPVFLPVAFFDRWEMTHFICWMSGFLPLLSSPLRETPACLPLSVACSEHLLLLSACLISQLTPKLPDLYRIHTTASKSSLRRATPLVHTQV